jgi:hypothetical protein
MDSFPRGGRAPPGPARLRPWLGRRAAVADSVIEERSHKPALDGGDHQLLDQLARSEPPNGRRALVASRRAAREKLRSSGMTG